MNLMTIVDKNRVAAYVRWSTDEQNEGTTLEVQLEACKLFIQSQGWNFRDELLFVDDGYSGSTLERPGLSTLRKQVAEGKISCVVVYKLDRLSRSVLDTVTLVLQEWDGICSVRSTREPIDTSNPAGSILFYMLASYAEWERSTIRERTMSGKIKRAQQGKNPGFSVPYGYDRGPSPGTMVINQAEAAVVRRIFRECANGKGVHTIAAGLNQEGIPPRRAAHWVGGTISKILGNPAYKGVLRYGCSTLTTKAQRRQVGKFRVFHAPKYAYIEGALPAIVSHEEFERAQSAVGLRNNTKGRRARGASYLLTGIARCRCGATLHGHRNAQKQLFYYRCSRNHLSAPVRCDCGLIEAGDLEQAVVSRVKEMLAPTNRHLLISGWQDENARRLHAHKSNLQTVMENLSKIDRVRSRIRTDYENGDLPARLYADHIAELDEKLTQVEERKQVLEQQIAELESSRLDLGEYQSLAEQVDSWDALDGDEKKQLIRHLVAGCVVYRKPSGQLHKGRRGRYSGNPNPVEIRLQLRRPLTWQ